MKRIKLFTLIKLSEKQQNKYFDKIKKGQIHQPILESENYWRRAIF
jgi:hypothetical protein